MGAATALLGVAAAYLGGWPEAALAEGPATAPLALLFLWDALKVWAAAALGLELARHVNSLGVAFLVTTAADLFSVFADPTRAHSCARTRRRWTFCS